MKCKTAREMNQCLWRCEAQFKSLPCIKPKKEYYETAHLFHFFHRWQAVYFIGNGHGCFLQSDNFSVPLTRKVSFAVQDLPSRIFQERDRTDRGKQNHLTQLWYLPGSIWQSPLCVSQGSVYRGFHFHVDALDSWTTIYFKLIIHVSSQSKLSLLFNPVSQCCLSQRRRILFLLVGDFICIAS